MRSHIYKSALLCEFRCSEIMLPHLKMEHVFLLRTETCGYGINIEGRLLQFSKHILIVVLYCQFLLHTVIAFLHLV